MVLWVKLPTADAGDPNEIKKKFQQLHFSSSYLLEVLGPVPPTRDILMEFQGIGFGLAKPLLLLLFWV